MSTQRKLSQVPPRGHRRADQIVGVSGQNAFLTGNVTGSVRNAALIIFHAGYEPRAIDRLDRACLSASHRAVRAEQLPGIPLNVGLSAHPGTPP
jgi:hypothetical protein